MIRADLPPLLTAIIRDSELTKKAFAEAVGLSSSAISRFLRGDGAHTMPIDVCLRIAKWAGVSPAKLLRAAGHGDALELIEDLFGPAAERRARFMEGRRLTASDEQMLSRYRALDPKMQRVIQILLDRNLELDAAERPRPSVIPPKKATNH